jgi:hypothetical protein
VAGMSRAQGGPARGERERGLQVARGEPRVQRDRKSTNAKPAAAFTTADPAVRPRTSEDDRGRCPVCGAHLAGHRRDARCCSPACRRELARIRRLSAGEPDGRYSTLREYTERRQRRAKPAEASRC